MAFVQQHQLFAPLDRNVGQNREFNAGIGEGFIISLMFRKVLAASLLSSILTLVAIPKQPQGPGEVTVEGGLGVVYACGEGLPVSPRVTLTNIAGNTLDLRVSPRMMATYKNYFELPGKYLRLGGHRLKDGSFQVSDAVEPRDDEKPPAFRQAKQSLQPEVQTPQSGSKPFVTILVRFADHLSYTPHPLAWYQSLIATDSPGLNPYYKQDSYNAINLDGSLVIDWINLPKKATDYDNSSLPIGADDEAVVKDAIAAVANRVDFTKFYGINVISNATIGKFGGTGGKNTYTLNGVTRTWGRTYDNDGSGMFSLLAHEMGHAFGFDHSSGPYNTPYDSDWDVMSRGSNYNYRGTYGPVPVLTNAYHHNIVSWIPKTRIYYGLPGTDQTIRLERTANPSANGYLTARLFPYGGGLHYLTLESRKFSGDYDHTVSLPHEGVVIHDVVEQRVTNDYWTGLPSIGGRNSEVVDSTIDNDPNDLGAVWTVGEKWTDAKGLVTMSVVASDASSYSVRIQVSANAAPPTEVRNVSDTGDSSLRSVLYYSNERPGTKLTFNLPKNPGPIELASSLPTITQAGTSIDAIGGSGSGFPVFVDGSKIGPWGDGIQIRSKNTTLRGLFFGNFPWSGISIVDSNSVIIARCGGGTSIDGTKAQPNGGSGLDVRGTSSLGTVSSSLFSGNSANGAYFEGPAVSGWKITSSKFGCDSSGSQSIPNRYNGIQFSKGVSKCQIGSAVPSDRNVLSGNSGSGIWMGDAGTSGNVVEGNYAGTDFVGSKRLGNKYSGIVIGAGSIGTSVASNIVSGNTTGIGIYDGATGVVLQSNFCGTDVTGRVAIPNTNNGIEFGNGAQGSIINNVCSGNLGNGIDVFGKGTINVRVYGNYTGLTANGLAPLPNSFGIVVSGGPMDTTVSHNYSIGGSNGGAIGVWGASQGTISGNFIGVGVNGLPISNSGSGISVAQASSGWQIGGTNVADRNVLASGGIGLYDQGTSKNTVIGNWVGFDTKGHNAPVSANGGISAGNGASANRIGGTTPAEANVIGNNTGNGISVWNPGSDGNTIQGNLIGVDPSGLNPAPIKYQGISIQSGAKKNVVGGLQPGAGNRIAGVTNGGVSVFGAGTDGNSIIGNLIGAKPNGSVIGNGWGGVQIEGGATNNQISNNIVVGFSGVGIAIFDSGTIKNIISQNTIGTDSKLSALNTGWAGIGIWGGASNNLIGGDGEGNLIAQSQIGIVINDKTSVGNTLRGNRIPVVKNLPIDLESDGVTANDALDTDTGPNNLQNFPVLSAQTNAGSANFKVTIDSIPSHSYRIDIYSAATVASQGVGAPDQFIGTLNLTTNSSGHASSSIALTSSSHRFCAIATDILTGDSSEVSAMVTG